MLLEINRLNSFYIIKDTLITPEDKLKLARKYFYVSGSSIRCANCSFVKKFRDMNADWDLGIQLDHENKHCIKNSEYFGVLSPFTTEDSSRDANIIYPEFRLATYRNLSNKALTAESGTPLEMAQAGFFYYKKNVLRCGYCKHILPFNDVITEKDLVVHKEKTCEGFRRIIERKIDAARNSIDPDLHFGE